ncbi:MAG: hypothetical protein U0V02_09145 [Anaerolineales bacterium]
MSTPRNTSALIGGTALIAVGILSLLGQVFSGYHFWGMIWPFLIIGVGGLFYIGMFAGGKSVSGLAVPATIITTIGLILFYQNITHNWESWSYAWTIILIGVGLGIYIMGAYGGDEGQRSSGMSVIKVGAILFLVFGGLFELVFFAGRQFGMRQGLFPVGLILLGLYLVITRLRNKDAE